MGIQEEKQALRDLVKEQNKHISDRQRILESAWIFRQVERLNVFQDAGYIMVFWSLEDEVFTHDFILKWHRRKHILLPAISGENILVKKFSGTDKLVKEAPFFIPEPAGESLDPGLIDLIIVPGVAFDYHYNRLGRGKAFYDRLLVQTEAFKLGVCFNFQLFESIPVSETDIKMDMVLSG